VSFHFKPVAQVEELAPTVVPSAASVDSAADLLLDLHQQDRQVCHVEEFGAVN